MRRTYRALISVSMILLGIAACIVEKTPPVENQPIEATRTKTPPPSATVYVDPIPIEELWNLEWLLNAVFESVSGDEEEAVGAYTLLLREDGTFTFKADCNVGDGTYIVEASSISFEIRDESTNVCEPGSLSDQYITWLETVDSFGLHDGYLVLRLVEGQGEMWYANMGIPAPTPTPTSTSTPEGTVTPTVGVEETPTTSNEAPPPPAEVIFSDDFSVNQYWYTGSGSFGEFKFVSGTYQITNNVQFANLWSVRSIEREDIGQQIEVVRLDGEVGGYYGLMCRVNNDVDNYYAFTIGSDGTYGIGSMENGKFRFLERVEDTDGIIKTDPGELNLLRGDCIGDRLILYINGKLMMELIDATHSFGEVGVLTGTWGDPGLVVRFDNYSAHKP